MTDIRELTMDEADMVSGGNPAVVAFVLGWAGTRLLDQIADGEPGPLYKWVKGKVEEKEKQKS